MKLVNLFTTPLLLEAKARIEHPEDLIFDGAVKGAKMALQILQTTADKPQSVSIKFDGSPALIFGWRGDEFILTDKAGFGAKGYDGLTTSGDAIEQMIMKRKMKDTSDEAVARRRTYAKVIASLYPILKAAVPKSFRGYAQGDLLYVGTPKLVEGAYQFKPNKIVYRVGANTELGELIGDSKVGMVVHSVFQSPQDEEPEALRDVNKLGWKSQDDLVVVPHEMELTQTFTLNPKWMSEATAVLNSHATQINKLFDPLSLADRNIKALPGLMKAFLAYKAGEGSNDFSHVAQEFINWLTSASSKASVKMQSSVGEWIRQNIDGYNAVWEFVKLIVDLKLDLKAQMDQQVGDIVSAELENKPGHEGFVSVTPTGIIKLVNRAEFMKKDTVKELTEAHVGDHAAWAFGRMNPPTLGHQQLVNTVAKSADGGDYFIFLSHSQDAKKNPLSYEDKKKFAQQIMPRHAAHFEVPDSIRTFLQAADWLYKQGYRSMTFVAGSDRIPDFEKHLQGWNSAPVREKYPLTMSDGTSQVREPIHIKFVSAGERDPDAEGLSGISGTKAREAVSANDVDAFASATGLSGDLANRMFHAVQKAMHTKKSKPVAEGIFTKIKSHFIGPKQVSLPGPVSLPEPSRFPPDSYRDIEPVVAWVRQKVAYEIHKGRDPVKTLFDPNYHAGDIWITIHASLSKDMSDKVKKHLWHDPEIGPLMRQAPSYDPMSTSQAPYSGSSSGSDYRSPASDDSMSTFTQNYINHTLSEDQEHANGTIAKLIMDPTSSKKLHDWCTQQGIDCIEPYNLHSTLMFSKAPAPQLALLNGTATHIVADIVGWKILGGNVLTLELNCPIMNRMHEKFSQMGASHAYPDFIPHTSVVYGWNHTQVPDELPDMKLVFEALMVEGIDPHFGESRK